MKKNNLFNFPNIFNNNTIVFLISLACAIIIWFAMAAENALGRPRVIYDVPITIKLSSLAQEEGIRVFEQNINKSSVSITGSNLIINKISADDLEIVANIVPMKQKLEGKTMQTETLNLTVNKKNNTLADYDVSDLNPGTITVVYDRYKEKTFNIENNIEYVADINSYVEKPHLSQSSLNISGPESSIEKINRVAVSKKIDGHISSSMNFTENITLYDVNNNVLNKEDLFLELSVNTVDVSIQTVAKQTVKLEVTELNLPEEFPENRIVISPATIEIGGSSDVVVNYNTIKLSTPIDFTKINLENNSITSRVPMPSNVKNISNVEEAKVTVNLNGYTETQVIANQFTFENVPEGKEVVLVNKAINTTVLSSIAQANKITSQNVFGTIDMAGFASRNGDVEVNVKMSVNGLNSAWVYGEHTILVTVKDKEISK